MTNEEALDILERHIECDNDNCPEPGMSCSECPYNVDAIDYARARKMAIEALSKQCASGKQVHGPGLFGQKTIVEPGEVFVGQNVLNDVLDQSAQNDEAIRTDDHIADDSKMVKLQKRTIIERLIIAQSLIEGVIFDSSNQFRDSTKKTDSERVSLPKQEKSNSFLKEPSESSDSEMNCSDVPDTNVGKIPYKKPEIIYCKDCRYRDPEDKKCDHGHGIVWQLPRPDNWFCADAERREDDQQ